MSNAQHTPGPWSYRSMKGYCTQIDGANGHTICCFAEDPKAADAKLLTAAPELLEALQRLSAQCTRLRLPGQTESDAERTARAVIAKATGGAE